MEPKSVEKASRSYVSAFDLFSKSSALVQANLGVYSIVVGVPILLSLIRNGILYGYGEGLKMMNGGLPFFGNGLSGAARDVTITGTAIALGLVIAVVGFIFAFMSVVLQYEVANGRKPTMSDLWEKVQKFGPRLFGLFIVVGLLVVLGFVALIVPGVILISATT